MDNRIRCGVPEPVTRASRWPAPGRHRGRGARPRTLWRRRGRPPLRRAAEGARRAGERPGRRGRGTGDGSGYSRPMTKWEYATVPLLVHATKQILDNWGEDGWELVQVVPGPNPEQLVAYLKREKQA
nr:hypothetical protein StreXyl84_29580 [Streptomyces sp. Xyl84]